jgi:hypothetical protein
MIWKLFNAEGKLLREERIPVEVDACTSLRVKNIDVTNDIQVKQSHNHVMFYILEDSQHNIQTQGFRLFQEPKLFPLQDPELYFQINDISKENLHQFEVIVSTKSISLYNYFESIEEDFIASDNYFSLASNETKKVILTILKPSPSYNADHFMESLKLGSLWHLLH